GDDVSLWTPSQLFLATMAYLQFTIFIINLIPVPPLDGFGAISPFMPEDLRRFLSNPRYQVVVLIILFMALSSNAHFWQTVTHWFDRLLHFGGFSRVQAWDVGYAYDRVLFSQSSGG